MYPDTVLPVGPRSRFADVAMAHRILTCGARLRPGALPLLTHFPAWHFTDRSVYVEEVFGARGRSLMNRLNEFRTSNQAVGVLADFLGGELAGCEYALLLSQGGAIASKKWLPKPVFQSGLCILV